MHFVPWRCHATGQCLVEQLLQSGRKQKCSPQDFCQHHGARRGFGNHGAAEYRLLLDRQRCPEQLEISNEFIDIMLHPKLNSVFKQTGIIIFLLICVRGSAQKLSFRGNVVNQVLIESSNGYYHIEKKSSIGSKHVFNIKYSEPVHKYIAEEYLDVSYENSFADTLQNKKTSKNKCIFKTNKNLNLYLDSLLLSLNKSIYPIDLASINTSKSDFEKMVNDKAIKKVIRQVNKNESFFERLFCVLEWSFLSKAEKKGIISDCQNIDTLNDYLINQFDTAGISITRDYWDVFEIRIITNSKNYYFYCSFENGYRHPWCDNTWKMRIILNPEINKFLLKILPNNFKGKRSLESNQLINEYLKWMLNKREVIFLSD